jgi:hypothetical protein
VENGGSRSSRCIARTVSMLGRDKTMGERYLVTGTQLGILLETQDKQRRNDIVDEIIDKQFIATSGQPIEADIHNIIKLLR